MSLTKHIRVTFCVLAAGMLSIPMAWTQCCRPMLVSREGSLNSNSEQSMLVHVQDREAVDVLTFRALLSDIDGFFDSKDSWGSITVGERRRQVLMEVLDDLWYTLPQMEHVDTLKHRVTIDFVALRSDVNDGAAWAEPLFIVNPNIAASVIDAAAHTLITTGENPLDDMKHSPGYHGRITLNTAYEYDLRRDECAAGKVSLYGVILHEVLHILGVASLIGQRCYEAGQSYQTNVVSRWDAMLNDGLGTPLIKFQCDGITVDVPSNLRGACGVRLNDTTQVHALIPQQYSPSDQGCLQDLSHFHDAWSSDSTIMRTHFVGGSVVNNLSMHDATALDMLGYEMSYVYGNFFRQPWHYVAYFDRAYAPISKRDTLSVRYGQITTMAKRDLQLNDTNTHTLRCIVSETPGLKVISTGTDSITLTAEGDPHQSAWLSQTWESHDMLGSTQRVLVRYIDSVPDEEQPCPPNTICNGDFESQSRPGSIEIEPYYCGSRTVLTHWRIDSGSVDAFVSGNMQRTVDSADSYYWSYHFPDHRAGRFPISRGTLDGVVNNGYIGMIEDSMRIPFHGMTRIEEGIAQNIVVDDERGGSWSRLDCWGYARSTIGHSFSSGAALRLIITDTSLCGDESCSRSPKALLDTVMIIHTPNAWVPLRTKSVYLPNGPHRVRITSTRCFRPVPDYGQGLEGYVLADDFRLVQARGTWTSCIDPEVVCNGQPFKLISRFETGLDTPVSVRSRIIEHPPGVRIDAADFSATKSVLDTSEIVLRHRAVLESTNYQVAHIVVERSAIYDAYQIVDTIQIPISAEVGVVALSDLQTKRTMGEITGSVLVTNLIGSRLTATGAILWKNGAQAPGSIILVDESTGDVISSSARSSDRTTYAPFIIHLDGFESKTLTIAASHEQIDSISDEQVLRVIMDAVGTACQSVVYSSLVDDDTVVPGQMFARVYPQPAGGFVRIEIHAPETRISGLSIYNNLAQLEFSLANPDDLLIRRQSMSFSVDTSELHAGVYYAVVSGQDSTYRVQFVVAP